MAKRPKPTERKEKPKKPVKVSAQDVDVENFDGIVAALLKVSAKNKQTKPNKNLTRT